MPPTLKIAVAGIGTVGSALIRLLQTQANLLEQRMGKRPEVVAVCARNPHAARDCDLSRAVWYDDPIRMAQDSGADIFVELMGGVDDPARSACLAALAAGRHIVTANKAMITRHGMELAREAERHNRAIACEGAVAGSIPILKTLREGLAANHITAIYGILNGTSNYILSTMRDSGRSFEDVLGEAQRLGYAEADPILDVNGVDTAHKLAILSALAFGAPPDFDSIHVEGIQSITPLDLAYAADLGCRIKLLGIAENGPGGLSQRVYPALVPEHLPIASVEGALNAVGVTSNFAGLTVLEGPGAGGPPTASAVAADIMDIATGRAQPLFGIPADRLIQRPALHMDDHFSSAYMRLTVTDRPGVLATITTILGKALISVESMIQRQHGANAPAIIILTLQKAQEKTLRLALEQIGRLDVVQEAPCIMRIESFQAATPAGDAACETPAHNWTTS